MSNFLDSASTALTEPGITDLPILGAWVYTPQIFEDSRGQFCEIFQAETIAQKNGYPFDAVQGNCSRSRVGVIRGIHWADVPPGQAKYVSCSSGVIVDVLVDLREGSPTFKQHVAITLDAARQNGLYIPIGVGHAFIALEDSSVNYLVNEAYNPGREHALNPFDPELAINWEDIAPGQSFILSEKDEGAPLLAELASSGVSLPQWKECRGWEKELRLGWEEALEAADSWQE